MTKNDVKNLVKLTIRKAFFKYYFEKPRVIDTKQLPLDIFFPEERKVSSLILGLSTSLGTRLWEELTLSLARMNNFTILDPKDLKQPSPMPKKLSKTINHYTSLREEMMNTEPVLLSDDFVPEIKKLTKNTNRNYKYINITKGEGADILLRKRNREYAFDIKTVQVNAGGGLKLNKTLLKWYAYRYHQQNSNIKNYSFTSKIVFPYNPYEGASWWDKAGGRAKPLDKHDVYVEDEFWKFITGLKKGEAWGAIRQGFKELHDEGFHEIYRNIFQLDGYTFRAVLFADRIKCNLITRTNSANTEIFTDLRNSLRWECATCNHRFNASVSEIKNKRKMKNVCPNCDRVFFDDIADLY